MQKTLRTAALGLTSLLALAAMPAQANEDMLKKYACVACHAVDAKKVGPAYKAVAQKYAGQADAVAYLAGKIQKGGKGVWGPIMMPAQSRVTDADAQVLAKYILTLK